MRRSRRQWERCTSYWSKRWLHYFPR